MTHVWLVALLTLGLIVPVVACGSPSKPPMTPDTPEMGLSPDGGTDTPTTPAPPLPSTPNAK